MCINPSYKVYKDLIVRAYPISLVQLEEILSVTPMDKNLFYTITFIGILAGKGFHYKQIKDMFESTNEMLSYFEQKYSEEMRK